MIIIAGILAILKKKQLSDDLKSIITNCVNKVKHRGENHTITLDKYPLEIYFHQKRKINNIFPLNFSFSKNNNEFIIIDGQIYNQYEINENFLETNYSEKYHETHLEGIIAGYKKKGTKIFEKLVGSFSGVLFNGTDLLGFKDPIGAKPLYYCCSKQFFVFSSELKALSPLNEDIFPVPPGFTVSTSSNRTNYYNFPKFVKDYHISKQLAYKHAKKLNELVKIAVKDNITNPEKTSALLSGGLDSSIITYIGSKHIKNLKVYTAGVKGSKDVFYAKKFAKKYNLDHTVVKVSLKKMLDCLPHVIYALETFDAALIRSSVPMFLVSKKINEDNNCEVLLTGEGADELFGGYDYLLDFESTDTLNQEFLNLLEVEHKTGLQRVDRIPYYFSIEARTPLFDKRLVEYSFKIPSELKVLKKGKSVTKKWILRKAFEDEMDEEFIWRKKQKFSDGAGSQFILRDHFEQRISDEEFYSEREITPFFTLRSKEELFYWRIFKSKFKPTIETIRELGITSNYEI